MITPEQRRARGIRAKVALDEGTITELFADVEADIHAEWSRARWSRTRENLHADLRALNRLRAKLGAMAGQAPRD